MKQKITRLFLDFEKEEKWLNEMSAKGLLFISYSFPRYLFEEGKPGEYTYRLELLKQFPSHAESKAYIKFMEENGVECVDTFMNWAYFRKKTADGPFDIYTDRSSRIKHYKRIATLTGLGVFINLANGLVVGILLKNPLSILNLAVAGLLIPLLLRFWKKAKSLKAESEIHE